MMEGSTQPTVLLADLDPESRAKFCSFFERAGWSYELALDQQALLGATSGRKFDVIIADVAMSSTEGAGDLFADIRRLKPNQAIIAVSREASFDDALQYFRTGASDLIPRPIDFSWLERSVRQLTNDSREGLRDKKLLTFCVRENIQYVFTSSEIAEIEIFSLPIVGRLVDAALIDDGTALRMRLAIQEAVTNGLEHGNLELISEWKEQLNADGVDHFSIMRKKRLQEEPYASRKIIVTSNFDGARLVVSVLDSGHGFLNQPKVSCQIANQSVKCSGRGLAMMSSAVDEVTFSKNGSEVTLVKSLPKNS